MGLEVHERLGLDEGRLAEVVCDKAFSQFVNNLEFTPDLDSFLSGLGLGNRVCHLSVLIFALKY